MSDEHREGHGRRRAADPNDKKYLLAPVPEAKLVTYRYWNTPPAYDQGSTSQCVAYSGARYLATGPIMNRPPPFEELYKECQRRDEWPGEDYDGTSVRALFKVFKDRGLVSEYRWAFDAETVVDHVLTRGPVVMGTTWNDEMANPTVWGYVTLGDLSELAGGHAWLVFGANRKRRNPDGTLGAVRAMNSWGSGWAQQGRFWVTFGDLDRLVKADGEACVATEKKT